MYKCPLAQTFSSPNNPAYTTALHPLLPVVAQDEAKMVSMRNYRVASHIAQSV